MSEAPAQVDPPQDAPAINQDIGREAAAILSEKVDRGRVHIRRWPSAMGPVVGPPIIIAKIDEVSEKLAVSGFMKPWIAQKIRDHLLAGGIFTNKGMTVHDDEEAIVPNGSVVGMQVRSEYRLATEAEVLDYVDHAQFANLTGRRITAKSQERRLALHYHEGVALIKKYDDLPRQAKVILDILNDTGRESFTEASVELLVTENHELFNTRQDPTKIYAFYRRRLIDEGHLEEVDGVQEAE